MRPGFASTIHRFAPLRLRLPIARGGEITRPALVFGAGILLAFFAAAQAQESVQEEPLPSWSEPAAPASTEAAPSTSAEPFPVVPPAPSTAAEPLPASESVPSAEQAFPSSPEPLSPSTNYNEAQTSVIPPPAPLGPFGAFDSKNVFPAGETISSGEPRRFHYELRLTVRGVWDDNIYISHTDRRSDYYFAIEPEITLGIGDIEGRNRSYLRLDYMPSIILFVDHSEEDAVQHLIHLEGGYNFGRLTLTASQDIAILDGANINSIIDTTGLFANLDVSQPTEVDIFNTRLRAQYDLTPKVYLQSEFDASIFLYPDFFSNYNISGGLYIYYNWLPKVSIGVGGTFGYNPVDDGSDQTYEQVNVRINYEATAKLNVYASAGAEFRQFDGHRDEYTSPVFEVGATYNPFVGTHFTLAAGRKIYNSGFFPDQDFASTWVVARFQQRLFQRVYLGLTGGYENDDYIAAARRVDASRDDDYWFIEPSIDVLITRWLSTGAYYLHRQNSSNDDFFSFYDNQVGVRATLRF